MTQVSIDSARCQGHGRCALIAPDVFDLDTTGMSRVLVDQIAGAHLDDAQEAAISCPENAIKLLTSKGST